MEGIKKYKLPEWQEEGKRLFGDDILNWKFKCPMCGHVATVREFKDIGVEKLESAYQECIGRYKGQGAPSKANGKGCNWVSYGLFGIPSGGVLVEVDNSISHIFDFAREE